MFSERKEQEIDQVLHRFEILRQKIQSTAHSLPKKLGLDDAQDLRIRYLNQLDHMLVFFDLNLFYFSKQVIKRDFLKNTMAVHDNSSYNHIVRNYEIFNKNSVIINLFGFTENLFRSILKELDPKLTTQPFWKIKHKIYELFQVAEQSNFRLAIELLNKVRNGVHNNGIYMPPNNNDKRLRIVYRNDTFPFSKGLPLMGFDYATVCNLCEDIFEGVCKMYEQPILTKISLILDPTIGYD